MKRFLLLSVIIAWGCICKAQTVTDADDNAYKVVTIGTQTWMAENLKTTKYNDGTDIPVITDSLAWLGDKEGAYTWFRNNIAYKQAYGALYNWYSVNTGKLCPAGWHVTTNDEWIAMENYLIANGYNYDGTTTGDRATNNKIAKSLAAISTWNPSDNEGTPGKSDYPDKRNATGFNALAAGFKDFYGSFGLFISNGQWFPYQGINGAWWSSSEIVPGATTSWWYAISTYTPNVAHSHNEKYYGLSVRCVMDNVTGTKEANSLTHPNEAWFYPNPATDKLYFKNISSPDNLLTISDVQGQQVLTKQIGVNPVDISKLKNGIYTVKLVEAGNIRIRKLIKQ